MIEWLGKTKLESECIKTRASFQYFERSDCIKTCVQVAGLMDYIDHPVHDGFSLSFNSFFSALRCQPSIGQPVKMSAGSGAHVYACASRYGRLSPGYKISKCTVLSRWIGKRHAQSHADCKTYHFSASRFVGHFSSPVLTRATVRTC